MRTPTDSLRSVKRHVALALGDEFEVRLSNEKGVFHRPFASVKQIPSLSMVTESWHVAKTIATYQVVAFPQRMDTADESQMEALRVVELLWVAFGGPGIPVPRRMPVDSRAGHPYRIPLYDYAGLPARGPNAAASENLRAPNDFLRVEAPPDVTPIANDDDELLWSVAANIRMSWLRSAAVPSTASTTVVVGVEASEQNG